MPALVRVAAGGARRSRRLPRSSLRSDCPALLAWGRAAKLATLTSFAALRQSPRVGSRSARVRAPPPSCVARRSTRRARRAPPAAPAPPRRSVLPAPRALGQSRVPPGAHRRTTCSGRARTRHRNLGVGIRRNATALPERQVAPAGRDVWSAEQRRTHGRARQRASTTDSPRLSERSERSERSEFRGGPCVRAAQGSRSASDDRGSRRGRWVPPVATGAMPA